MDYILRARGAESSTGSVDTVVPGYQPDKGEGTEGEREGSRGGGGGGCREGGGGGGEREGKREGSRGGGVVGRGEGEGGL